MIKLVRITVGNEEINGDILKTFEGSNWDREGNVLKYKNNEIRQLLRIGRGLKDSENILEEKVKLIQDAQHKYMLERCREDKTPDDILLLDIALLDKSVIYHIGNSNKVIIANNKIDTVSETEKAVTLLLNRHGSKNKNFEILVSIPEAKKSFKIKVTEQDDIIINELDIPFKERKQIKVKTTRQLITTSGKGKKNVYISSNSKDLFEWKKKIERNINNVFVVLKEDVDVNKLIQRNLSNNVYLHSNINDKIKDLLSIKLNVTKVNVDTI